MFDDDDGDQVPEPTPMVTCNYTVAFKDGIIWLMADFGSGSLALNFMPGGARQIARALDGCCDAIEAENSNQLTIVRNEG